MRRIGAHVTTNGGLSTAIAKAQEIGANCIQIFSSPPQQWQMSRHTEEQKVLFRDQCRVLDLSPIFIHGTYLINLASDNQELVDKSCSSLISDLQFCSIIGGGGVIFHLGSHPNGWTGSKRHSMINLFRKILAATPEDAILAIENSAGGGNAVAATIESLATIQDDVGNPRLRFCLDTAHAFAQGYDLHTPENIHQFVTKVEETIGWDSVIAIHLNDSKTLCGSKSDRHDNIGEGKIGKDGLQYLLQSKAIETIPLVLETPGFDDDGPDKKNLDIVKALLSKK